MTLSWGINKSGELESYNTHEIKAVPVEDTVHVEADPVVIGERFVPTKDASEIEHLNFSTPTLTNPPLTGRKFDKGKLDWTIFPWEVLDSFIEMFGEENLPWKTIEDVVKVLEYGAKLHARDNWKSVADGIRRYKAASLRHKMRIASGEEIDSESGLPHRAHVITNNVFVEYLRRREGK